MSAIDLSLPLCHILPLLTQLPATLLSCLAAVGRAVVVIVAGTHRTIHNFGQPSSGARYSYSR